MKDIFVYDNKEFLKENNFNDLHEEHPFFNILKKEISRNNEKDIVTFFWNMFLKGISSENLNQSINLFDNILFLKDKYNLDILNFDEDDLSFSSENFLINNFYRKHGKLKKESPLINNQLLFRILLSKDEIPKKIIGTMEYLARIENFSFKIPIDDFIKIKINNYKFKSYEVNEKNIKDNLRKFGDKSKLFLEHMNYYYLNWNENNLKNIIEVNIEDEASEKKHNITKKRKM